MSDIPLVDLVRARRQGLSAAIAGTQGATGPAGVAIVSANVASGNLIITLSDANVINAGSITAGVQGATGPIGLTGNVGATGSIGATGPAGAANVFVFYLTSNVQSGAYLPVFGANSNIFLNAGKYEIEALVNFKKLTNDGYVQFALKSDGTAEVVGQLIGENSGNVVTGFRSTGITSYWPATRVLTTSGTDTYTCTLKALFKTNSGNIYLFPVLSNGSMSTESGSYLKITQLPDNTSSNFTI